MRSDYRAQGFAVLRGAVAPALVARLGAAVDRVQAGVATMAPAERARLVLERDQPPALRGGVPAEAVGDAIFILGEPSAFDPLFEAVLAEPAVLATARALLQTEAVVAHFMNVTIKHPRFGSGIRWHRDFPNAYICTEGADFLRLMLCLDGMDDDTGATCFLPASHQLSDEAARHEKRNGRRAPVDEQAAVTLRCAPGDLVAIHPKVLHGGGMNRGARPRRNLVLQVGRAQAALVTSEREAITGRLLA
ncbi:phytanoyl-CoA dioxygenase family protein [Pseudorhodoferax sp.]|uniref:phytanoyl-CoA dioxygenase family protein n=1 Tax=Pseudorhodoferax sp. TaxID=1993553 RepID=UPI002DD6230D|nr:phytanoyl-CoA dioxygenase family protein [Pseudorhodoferax sp.]